MGPAVTGVGGELARLEDNIECELQNYRILG